MNRPDQLLVCETTPWGGETLIQALFLHEDSPIVLRARVNFVNRDAEMTVYSTCQDTADIFMPEELYEACYCNGAMKPEHKQHTEATRALLEKCTEPMTT